MNPEEKEAIMEKLTYFDNQFQQIQSEYIEYIQHIYNISKDEDIKEKVSNVSRHIIGSDYINMLDDIITMCNRKCFSQHHLKFYLLQMLNNIDCGLPSKIGNESLIHFKSINQTVVDRLLVELNLDGMLLWIPDKVQENKKHLKEACDYYFGKDAYVVSEQLPESKKNNIVWWRLFTLHTKYREYMNDLTRKYIYRAIKLYFYH